MDTESIIEALGPVVSERGLKIVKVKISKDNDVTVTIASRGGAVTMDDCVEVNREFTRLFDQDKEDYSVTVTSPGPSWKDEDEDE